MANTQTSNKLITAALLGSFAGAGIGLLLAPKSGQELRQDLAGQAHKIGGKASEIKVSAQNAWQNVEDKTQLTFKNSRNWLQKGKQIACNFKTLVKEIKHGALTETASLEAPDKDRKTDTDSDYQIIESNNKPEFVEQYLEDLS